MVEENLLRVVLPENLIKSFFKILEILNVYKSSEAVYLVIFIVIFIKNWHGIVFFRDGGYNEQVWRSGQQENSVLGLAPDQRYQCMCNQLFL